MKKILIVTDSLRIGGLEKIIVDYIKYCNTEKYEFTYLLLDNNSKGGLEKEVLQNGGNIIKLYPPKKNYIKFYRDFKNIVRKHGPFDIVHSHPAFTSGILMKASYKLKIPKRISHSHTDKRLVKENIFKKIYELIMKRYLRKYSTDCLAVSQNAGKYLFGESFFNKKGTILENGIEFNDFFYNPKIREKLRNSYNLNNDKVIGHVGTFNKTKNQSFLIDILNELLKTDKHYKLLLVGDGKTREELKLKAKSLNIENNVIFVGRKDTVSSYLQAMDLFVFPSMFEGLPLSVLESQAAKLTTIISDKVPQEVLITNYIHVISLECPPSEWANKIKMLKLNERENLNNNPLLNSNYEIKKSIEKLQSIYEN